MIAGLILAGGENRRMGGRKKCFLEYGGESFLARERRALSPLPVVFLSVEDRSLYGEPGLLMLEDRVRGIGPLGGLYTALCFGKEYGIRAFLTVSCDLPFVNEGAVRRMLASYEASGAAGKNRAAAARAGGRLHPLFGVYPTAALSLAEEQIRNRDYKLTHLLDRISCETVDFEDGVLTNVNTPGEYAGLLHRAPKKRKPFFFAVSGYKNSGKTTLLTRLIPELTGQGLKVAVVKHDGHDFVPDVPGTDTDRCRLAGAFGTAVYSAHRFQANRTCADADEKKMAEFFPDADIILIEGLKESAYPKIFCEYPQKPLPDAAAAAKIILAEYRKSTAPEIDFFSSGGKVDV